MPSASSFDADGACPQGEAAGVSVYRNGAYWYGCGIQFEEASLE